LLNIVLPTVGVILKGVILLSVILLNIVLPTVGVILKGVILLSVIFAKYCSSNCYSVVCHFGCCHSAECHLAKYCSFY
jgi:hypothetical protein